MKIYELELTNFKLHILKYLFDVVFFLHYFMKYIIFLFFKYSNLKINQMPELLRKQQFSY